MAYDWLEKGNGITLKIKGFARHGYFGKYQCPIGSVPPVASGVDSTGSFMHSILVVAITVVVE